MLLLLTTTMATVPGKGGGGGGDSAYERGGDARCLFWSHLGCSGKTPSCLAVKVSFRVAREKI